jgi:hypothetical protein
VKSFLNWFLKDCEKRRKILKQNTMSKMAVMIRNESTIRDMIPSKCELADNTAYIDDYGDYIKITVPIKSKQKTLEDYEQELTHNHLWLDFYYKLKVNFPKQYYSIILQMIADDICDKKMELNWCMAFHCSGQVDYRNLINETKPQGTVLFDTLANVKKARDLLDDNIKYLS